MVFLGRHTQGPCTLIRRAAAASIEVLQVVLTETRILFSVPFYLPRYLQGGFDPSKKSGVGVDFEHLVNSLPGPNKDRARKPTLI